MRHLLGIETLTRDEIVAVVANAIQFTEVLGREVKKVPTLRGRTIINLFLEPSTRTRTSFEIAAKRLSADAINVSESGSSISKGETLLDTAQTLEAMTPDIVVIRHRESGAAQFLARHLKTTGIINAGDGTHEHPTQALLDLVTLANHPKFGLKGIGGNLTIAIVGDILHSRVARSNIWAHIKLGNKIRLVGPHSLLPKEIAEIPEFKDKVTVHRDLRDGLKGADVVMCLRLQLERQEQNFIPTQEEYCRRYCVTESLLKEAAPNSVVLHPGPMNRGVEISSEVADGPRSLIQNQVTMGVAVRMATLLAVASSVSVGHTSSDAPKTAGGEV